MNITPAEIYWITRLDGLNLFFDRLSCVLYVSFFGVLIFQLSEYGYEEVLTKRKIKLLALLLSLALTFSFTNIFIPTTKEAMAMYVIPEISNSQFVQKLPDEAQKVIDQFVKHYTENKSS